MIVIANWKMKLGVNESKKLTNALKNISAEKTEVIICPSFVSLQAVGEILKKSKIKLGAQDCFWETKGAYTGEISAEELKEIGCDFVILGHSERRQSLSETDEMVHKKVKAALAASLVPIICVGETFDQRQQGATDYILIQQTTKTLEGVKIDFRQRIIIAYEPVWVIGSGQAVAPAEAASASQVIRQTLFDLFPVELIKNNFAIIYGGSVDSDNVSSFTQLGNIDGFLVGSASLNAEEFVQIAKSI